MTNLPLPSSDVQLIASRFVKARLNGESLATYPGPVPQTAADAYAIQDAAIQNWPESVAGWKVGLVAPNSRSAFGAERLAGPTFMHLVSQRPFGVVSCPVFSGGFAAVEAEFVVQIGKHAPPNQTEWHADEMADYVFNMHVGVEIASSPFAHINDLGPCVTASDFGNHFGLLVGAAIPDWQQRPWNTLTCETWIEDTKVGEGSADALPGGPLSALAFVFGLCARRGMPMRAGQFVCTGATTGVHPIRAGQRATIKFHGLDTIQCRIMEAGKYPIQP